MGLLLPATGVTLESEMLGGGRQLTERDAAVALGVSRSCLRVWRHRGQGPPFLRLGRCIRYAEADLAGFLSANRFDPSQPKGGGLAEPDRGQTR